jgi:hypothetical protein
VNPYPGTRYARVDLSRIAAVGMSCRLARVVARGAHREALALPVPPTGVRHFAWNGWRVIGDLRRASDSYVAARGVARRVHWRF